MPDTVATVQNGKLGPGVLKIGATGTSIDISCLLNNATLAADPDQADDTTKLCGDVRAGAVTYSRTLSGNVDTDVGDAAGLFALSQSAAGSQQAFEFTPSSALGTSAAGFLVIHPLDFGADEMGADLTSDFEWGIVGEVVWTYGTGVETLVGDDESEAA
jgi:hypothetical protein